MKIYNYNHKTFEYIGEGLADESPLEKGVYLIPANATELEPPVFNNKLETCSFKENAWKIEKIILSENEAIIDGEVVTYNSGTQKVVDNLIVDKTREDYIKEDIITLESEKEKARLQRSEDFQALDLYDKAVLRGDMEETAEMKAERDSFRNAWLELPDEYTDISIVIETLYPVMPEKIEYFK